MKKNLDIANPRLNERIWPVPSNFVKSRFHCKRLQNSTQGPTQVVRLIEVSVKRELTVHVESPWHVVNTLNTNNLWPASDRNQWQLPWRKSYFAMYEIAWNQKKTWNNNLPREKNAREEKHWNKIKDGFECQNSDGLQATNLKNLGLTFQSCNSWQSPFNT